MGFPLFWKLLSFVFSLSHSITSDTANHILNQSENFPLFVYIWDSWCPHCKLFTPVWQNLSNLPDFQNRLHFADLQCAAERKLCRILSPGTTLPRLIWLDSPTSSIQRYSGAHDLLHLIEFIRNQFGNTLQIIKSVTQLEQLIANRMHKSLFIFNITSTDNTTLSLISRVTFQLRHFPVNYAIFPDISPHLPVIYHVTSDMRRIQFSESMTHINLINFVKSHSIPFFAPYPGDISHHAELEGISLCIFVFPQTDNEISNRVVKIARSVSEIVPVVHTSCEFNPKFCRYVGLRKNVGVIFLNKSRNDFWVSDLKASQVEWIKEIFAGKWKSEGPGEGLFSKFWLFFFEMRGRGGFRYWILYFPVVLMCVYLILWIFRCFYDQAVIGKLHKE
jgi:thiol-disulfide isomerase/thioredoxin